MQFPSLNSSFRNASVNRCANIIEGCENIIDDKKIHYS